MTAFLSKLKKLHGQLITKFNTNYEATVLGYYGSYQARTVKKGQKTLFWQTNVLLFQKRKVRNFGGKNQVEKDIKNRGFTNWRMHSENRSA